MGSGAISQRTLSSLNLVSLPSPLLLLPPLSLISLPLATHLTSAFLPFPGKGCGARLFRYKKKNGMKSSL